MATNFNDIFEQFLLIIDDPRFINNFTSDCLAVTLSKYLDRARGIFGDYCYKNLNLYTQTVSTNYSFVADGIHNEYILSSTPLVNSEFYVSVNNVETNNYTYNSLNNSIILTSIPNVNDDVYIGVYKIGEFTNDLNIQEITFLARGMTIPYLEFQLQKEKHLNQIVYGKDFSVHSQANHINANRETLESSLRILKQDMMMYTYKQSDDNLHGSTGAYSL